MKTRLTKDLYTELCDEHWRIEYNWKGVDPAKVADRHYCSADYVRRVMVEIEKDHPKPKQTNASTCKVCGAPVIYLGDHACDPTVFKGVSADGILQTIRFPHANTCANQWKGKSGADLAAGE